MAKYKIMLVDDDPEDRSIIIDSFTHVDAHLSIEPVENGEAALELLSGYTALDDFPCLIILDLNMPKMNGRETLSRIKNDPRLKNIAVVIYSTSINPLEKEICMQLGAHAYLTKPVSYKENMEIARWFLQLCAQQMGE